MSNTEKRKNKPIHSYRIRMRNNCTTITTRIARMLMNYNECVCLYVYVARTVGITIQLLGSCCVKFIHRVSTMRFREGVFIP